MQIDKIQRQAFERGLWAAADEAEAEGWPCPPDARNDWLEPQLAAAWREGDHQRAAALGRILWRRGRLDPVATARLRTCLLRLGRFAEAVTLTERRAAPDARGAYERAWALTGLDQHDLAVQTLAVAQAKGLGREEAEPLAQILEAEVDPGRLDDWDAAGRTIEAALSLGLNDPAARLMGSELARAGFGFELDGDPLLLAALARAALRGCGAPAAGLLLEAAEPLYGHGADQAAYHAVRESLAGAPETPVDMDAGPDDPERFALRHLLALACAASGRRAEAIRRLGGLCEASDAAGEAHVDLARLVGQESLAATPLAFAAPGERRRIFDVFPFDGEIAALELKLREMAGWVDAFVIVEARQSLDGRPKPLHFEEHRSRFEPLAGKIVHVVVDAFPDHLTGRWARAFHLRDQALKGLCGLCAPQDLVLLTDPEEILDGRVLTALERPFEACELSAFAYFLNLRELVWPAGPCAAAVEARFLAGAGAGYARLGMQLLRKARLGGAGWRFARLGDPAMGGGCPAREAILAGQAPSGFQRTPLGDSFPGTVLERQDELADLILEA